MTRHSPTKEGFGTMFRRPVLGVGEIAWRWTLGVAGLTLLVASAAEYLDSLTVTPADIFLLRTRQPILAQKALAHIFRGSGPRAVAVFLILAAGFALAWIVVGALGRLATLEAIAQKLADGDRRDTDSTRSHGAQRRGVASLMGLNFLRVAITVAALVGVSGVFLLPDVAFRGHKIAPGIVALLAFCILFLLCAAWAGLNWFLSLASVFVVGEGRDAFGALAAAVDLCRRRTSAVLGVSAWFGLAHLGAFVVATSVVQIPLSMAGFTPLGVVLALLCGVTLLYFAAVDFLYIGRLTAYTALARPEQFPMLAKISFVPPPAPFPLHKPPGRFDPDELILSDLPASEPSLG